MQELGGSDMSVKLDFLVFSQFPTRRSLLKLIASGWRQLTINKTDNI